MDKKKKPKKNQLPSGSYRVQVYDYTDVDGKKHYKSFTAPTRRQAQFLAAEWQQHKEEGPQEEDLIVYKAIGRYLDVKRSVLSLSTLRSYESMWKNYFKGTFGATKLSDLTNPMIQIWISSLAGNLTPKTVRNAYGLLSAAIEMFYPDFRIKCTLPARKKPDLYTPNDSDLRILLEHIRGTDLEIAVLLAAFGPLRRGEICALTDKDIHGNCIEVNKSMVQGPDKLCYVKQPKTYSSYRSVEMSDFFMKQIETKKGRLVNGTPNSVTQAFKRALKKANLPHFRFHDLRHSYATNFISISSYLS